MSRAEASKKSKVIIKELQSIRKRYNRLGLSKYVSIGSTISSSISPFFDKPGVFSFVKSGINLIQNFLPPESLEDYFDGEEWESLFPKGLVDFIALYLIHNYKYEVISDEDCEWSVLIFDVDGVKCGWKVSSGLLKSSDYLTNPFVWQLYHEAGKQNHIIERLSSIIWDSFENKSIVLGIKISKNYEWAFFFEQDSITTSLSSEVAERHIKNFQLAFDANETRSILFYGPPGSGKSTLARQISNKLNLKTLRIKISAVQHDNTIKQILSIIKPDCIILDDFDRSQHQDLMLDTLYEFRLTTKLIIATANNRSDLDEAILRPERIDEIEFIDRLDEQVIRSILEGEPEEQVQQMIEWPVAFITEYKRRRKWLTVEEAKNSIVELAERVKRLDEYSESKKDHQKILTSMSNRQI
jgi:adenylate kinase family enzyme